MDKNLLRHPLFITVVGFLLTGILGAIVAGYVENTINERQQISQEIKNRKLAVSRLSRHILERKERAALLLSSFKRNAEIEEIKQRKIKYDEVYVKWNTHLKENLFLISEILDEKSYKQFEDILVNKLVRKIFKPLDTCLTRAYDAELIANQTEKNNLSNTEKEPIGEILTVGMAIKEKAPIIEKKALIRGKDVLKKCRGQILKTKASRCGDAIASQLYHLSKQGNNINGEQKFLAYSQMSTQCSK